MPFVFMTDRSTGRCALFEENGTMGSVSNPNSVRNAPLNSPNLHLDKIRFHSDFDYYAIESGPTSVNVNHPSLVGGSFVISTNPNVVRYGQINVTNHTLLSHGLPYVPAYMIISNGALVGAGSDIQNSSESVRTITPYATSSIIGLRDFQISGTSSLPAISRTYQIIVFRNPIADMSHLFDYVKSNDRLILGKGKFQSNRKFLRRTLVADLSPFDIALGRTVDIKNGGSRTVFPDGTTYTDFLYNGSFTGSPSIECTVE